MILYYGRLMTKRSHPRAGRRGLGVLVYKYIYERASAAGARDLNCAYHPLYIGRSRGGDQKSNYNRGESAGDDRSDVVFSRRLVR